MRHIKISCLALLLCLAWLTAVQAGPAADQGSKILSIRMHDIAKFLAVMDDWSAATGKGKGSFSAKARQALGGLDWIDQKRVIAAAMDLSAQQPSLCVLAPFVSPSQEFEKSFNPVKKSNYYLLTWPLGQNVPDSIEKILLSLSKQTPPDMLSMEIPVASLAKDVQDKIAGGLAKLQQQAARNQAGPGSADLMKAMASSLPDLMRQISRLTLGLTMNQQKLRLRVHADAIPQSALAKSLSVQPGSQLALAGYKPSGQIILRSRPYDISSLMGLLNSIYGPLYKSMGMDISCYNSLAPQLTGEMAMAITLKGDKAIVEGMTGLKSGTDGDKLVSSLMSCWASNAKNAANSMKNLTGAPENLNPWTAAPGSTVAGHKVLGMKMNMPPAPPGSPPVAMPASMEYRMTTEGNVLLVASSDKRLASLIKTAKTLKPQAASGPLMRMDMDLGTIIGSAVPGALAQAGTKKKTGAPPKVVLNMTLNFASGSADADYSVSSAQIKSMISYITKLQARMAPKAASQEKTGGYRDAGPPQGTDAFGSTQGQSAPPVETSAPDAKSEEDIRKENIEKLFNKANLVNIYGSPQKAIPLYKKVLALDPENARASFALGVALGETGAYEKGMAYIEKALEQEPDNPEYLYGQARINLLSGKKGLAMEQFEAAAEAGSEDAQSYLLRNSGK